MKKYVKPIMESEEFVTNEYISACWTAQCGCTNEILFSYTDNPIDAATKFANGGNVYPYTDNGLNYLFDGTINGSEGCIKKDEHNDSSYVKIINGIITFVNFLFGSHIDKLPTTGIEGAHHHIVVTDVTSKEHPNHS